jgi:hypothetical protein
MGSAVNYNDLPSQIFAMKQRQQLEQRLTEKTMKDPAFRKRLLENPKAVIESETGIDLPASVSVHILEEDPGIVYIVLPHPSAAVDAAETKIHRQAQIAWQDDNLDF